MNTGRFFRSMIFLLVFGLAVACSSDGGENDPSEAVEGVSDAAEMLRTPTPMPTSIPEISTEELFGNAGYEVVYVHDGTLFNLASDMSQPEAVEANVHPASLALAPDYSTLLFGIKDPEGPYITVQKLGIVNLTTRETTMVDLPEGESYMPPAVQGWSPSSEWVLVSFSPNNDKLIVLNLLTGTHTWLDWYSEGERPRTFSALWLMDNTLLVHAERDVINDVADMSDDSIAVDDYIFDPITSEQHPIRLSEETQHSLSLRLSPTTLNTVDKELQNQGLALAELRMALDEIAYYPDMVAAAAIDTHQEPSDLQTLPCDLWSIQVKPVREAALPRQLYQVDNVAILSDPYLLPDESLLVAQWKSPICDRFQPETLTVELVHINTDGNAKVVASGVSYGWLFDFSTMIYPSLSVYGRSNIYAVSPEGRYVAWVKDAESTSSIVVSDLETIQLATLVELTHTESAPNDDGDLFTSVILFRTTQ